MITIYHNPRCSKSRETLVLVQEIAEKNGLPLQVIEYLQTPLTVAALKELRKKLAVDARNMVRENEPEFAELQLQDAGQARLLQALAEHPRLLQRPIVEYRGRAAIGRPPEQVLTLFNSESPLSA